MITVFFVFMVRCSFRINLMVNGKKMTRAAVTAGTHYQLRDFCFRVLPRSSQCIVELSLVLKLLMFNL